MESSQSDASEKSAAIFWRELEQGKLPLPFCPALVEDLYQGYACFCRGAGVRPMGINRFIPAIMAMGPVDRIVALVEPEAGYGASEKTARRRRRVLLVGYRRELEQRYDPRRVARGVREFHFALRAMQWKLGAQEEERIAQARGRGRPSFNGEHSPAC